MATDNPNAPPSRDPANDDSLQGLFDTVLGKFLQGIDDMLPARVISYDRPSNRAVIAPMVALLTTSGAHVPRASVASVPVLLLGGGGNMLSFNLKAGDMGWLKANDRDISLFLQNPEVTGPNTLRKHSFEDAMFIPDALRGFTIAAEDLENTTLQTLDGKYRISLWSDRVKITADTTTFEVSATGVNFNGVSFKINGKELVNHFHNGVTIGLGNTGPNQ